MLEAHAQICQLAARTSAGSTGAPSPLAVPDSRPPPHRPPRRPNLALLLRGRALVRRPGLWRRVLEDTEPAVGHFRRLLRGHLSRTVRNLSGFQAGLPS